jgi:hypothetical protein
MGQTMYNVIVCFGIVSVFTLALFCSEGFFFCLPLSELIINGLS